MATTAKVLSKRDIRWASCLKRKRKLVIFITVGNANQKFGRLIGAVEKLANQGYFFNENIIIQIGHNMPINSRYCEEIKFIPMYKFVEMISKANLVISHGGAGTLFHVLSEGKIPVVMPRRKKYEEHVDDHQTDIVRALSRERRIIPAYEPEELADAIAEARENSRQPRRDIHPQMLLMVDKAIKEFGRKRE
jgi:UDP-N-acetylglucosamine transferase subunit ALG13